MLTKPPAPTSTSLRTSLNSILRCTSPSRPPSSAAKTLTMAAYLPSLPSLKIPSIAFQTRSPQIQDAPLDSLPPAERAALDTFISKALPILSTPQSPLHPTDPWSSLSSTLPLRDEIFIRLLRFNNLSIDRALRQLRNTLQWRARSHVHTESLSVMHDTRAGIPVSLLPTAGSHGEQLFFAAADAYSKRDIDHRVQELAVARMFEHVLYDVDGPQVKRLVVVVDFTDFSFKNIDLVGLKNGVSTYMGHYPDVFHKILLVNYPRFMYGVWRVIRPLLDERTAATVVWVSTKEALHKELEEVFPKAQLPSWVGGDSEGGDITLLNGFKVDVASLVERCS